MILHFSVCGPCEAVPNMYAPIVLYFHSQAPLIMILINILILELILYYYIGNYSYIGTYSHIKTY